MCAARGSFFYLPWTSNVISALVLFGLKAFNAYLPELFRVTDDKVSWNVVVLNCIPACWLLPEIRSSEYHMNNILLSYNQDPTVMGMGSFTLMVTLLPTATGFFDGSRVNAKRPRRGRRASQYHFHHIK